eukprot:1024151-Ditylum_brightwellii.AAC.1
MANIKSDADPTSETSKRHHFELAGNYLQSFCPVLKKFPPDTKHDNIKISYVSGSGFGTKSSAGKTGILLKSMRHSPSHRRMKSKSGKRSPSLPSHGKQMDVAKGEAKEERGSDLVVSEITTSKAGQLQHLATRT